MTTATNGTSWVTLPYVRQRLSEVTHIGNGKDADLILQFADGRRIEVEASKVRVEVDRGIVVDVSAWGDTMLKISYTGANVSLKNGRISCPSDDARWQAEFVDEARAWLESDGSGDLGFVVDAELQLSSTQ